MKDNNIAGRIVIGRINKDWKQCRLAQEAGISRSYLHEIEAGKIKRISAEMLYGIAKALGTSIETLLGQDRLVDTVNTTDEKNREIERLRAEVAALRKQREKVLKILQP